MPKVNVAKKVKSKYVFSAGELWDLSRRYPDYDFRVPVEEESSVTQLQDELAVPLDHFATGFTLPIPEFLLCFFQHFDLLPAMLTPNSYAILIALHDLYAAQNIIWSVENIMAMLTFVSKEKGVMFAQVRHSKEFGITGYQNAYHGWRNKFVWVKCREGSWPLKTVVDDAGTSPFKGWAKTKEITDLYSGMGASYFTLDVSNGTIDTSRNKRKTSEVEGEEPEERVVPKPTPKKQRKSAGKSPPIQFLDLSKSDDEEEEDAAADGDQDAAGEGGVAPEEGPSGADAAGEGGAATGEGTGGAEMGGASIGSGEPTTATADGTGSTAEGSSLRRKGKEAAPEGDASTERRKKKMRTFRFYDKEGYLNVKYNADHDWFPDFLFSDLPDAMVQSQFSPKVLKELQSMKELQLIQLQSHMAFSSALVGKYLGATAKARRMRLEDAVRAQDRWKEEETKYRNLVASLKKESQDSMDEVLAREENKAKYIKKLSATLDIVSSQVEESKLAAANANSAMLSQGTAHAKERNNWEEERALLVADNNRLEEKIAAGAAATAAHDDAIALLKAEVEALSKKVSDDADAAKKLTGQIGDEAVMAYKYSEDFLGDMSDFQIAAVNIMKTAMVKDGKLSKEEAAQYDYETCMERDAQGEFTDLYEK